MRDESSKKTKVCFFKNVKLFFFLFLNLPFVFFFMKLSWPKSLVKKWFNIKSKAEDFQADDIVYGGN